MPLLLLLSLPLHTIKKFLWKGKQRVFQKYNTDFPREEVTAIECEVENNLPANSSLIIFFPAN
jgi:hypothetical protein